MSELDRYEMDSLEQKRRAEKYGCNGKCYWDSYIDENGQKIEAGCCSGIDTCEETKTQEFFATILSFLFVLAVPVGILFLLFWII